MKKLLISSTLLVALLFQIGCSVEPIEPPKGLADCDILSETITSSSSKAFDDELLWKLSEAVYKESKSGLCQTGDIWGIAGVGAKPCGGPAGYIPFKKDNEACFLKVLARYNQQAKVYNTKYKLISNCLVEPVPASVDCREGKPVLVY